MTHLTLVSVVFYFDCMAHILAIDILGIRRRRAVVALCRFHIEDFLCLLAASRYDHGCNRDSVEFFVLFAGLGHRVLDLPFVHLPCQRLVQRELRGAALRKARSHGSSRLYRIRSKTPLGNDILEESARSIISQ